MKTQEPLCEEVHGKQSNWYFDLQLDKMKAYGMINEQFFVLNSYHDLMNEGEKASEFFNQFQTYEILGYIADAYEAKKSYKKARHFLELKVEFLHERKQFED